MARLSFTGSSIVDDRGTRVPVADAQVLGTNSYEYIGLTGDRGLSDQDRARRELWRRARRAMHDHPVRRRFEIGVLAVLGLVLLAGAWFYGALPGMLCSALTVAGVALARPLYRLHTRYLIEGELERLAVLPFVCVACGYDLDALEPERDGCVVCPECAGAWERPETAGA